MLKLGRGSPGSPIGSENLSVWNIISKIYILHINSLTILREKGINSLFHIIKLLKTITIFLQLGVRK